MTAAAKEQPEEKPTENKLINEPYERIDRLNYKGKADDHIAFQTQALTDSHQFSNQTMAAIIEQQREGVQDVRSQRDQLFSQFLQLNATSIDLARSVTASHADVVVASNANSVDHARRTAATHGTLDVKTLDTDTNEINSQAIGAEVASGVAPVIGTAVEAAVAQRNQSGSDAQGMTALNTAATTNLSQLTAAMTQAITALNSAVQALQTTGKQG